MRQLANDIIDHLLKHGATNALFVGGCVRDQILSIEPKDFDVEVYGLPLVQVSEILAQRWSVNLVGESFGVIKVNNIIDVSVPRRENKIGRRHDDFEVHVDHAMTPTEAASRRDFTINSMMMNRHGIVVDPFGGKKDLEQKVIRHTSDAFSEDPLRVLRAMQFAARFNFTLDHATGRLCETIFNEYQFIAKERVFEEWWKWATKSVKPSAGLQVLLQTGWIKHFPEIADMIGVPQDPIWHPEGDCATHTFHVCDAAADIAKRDGLDEEARGILLFAALAHDFGKVSTTKRNDQGRWSAHGHAEAGVKPSLSFLSSIGAFGKVLEHVPPLVAEHMAHAAVRDDQLTHRIVRRLANRLAPANMLMWSRVCESDHNGRPPLPHGNPVEKWLEIGETVEVTDGKPKPILMGRHLLELGLQPGPKIGVITKSAFEQQLDGTFTDLEGALVWFNKQEL